MHQPQDDLQGYDFTSDKRREKRQVTRALRDLASDFDWYAGVLDDLGAELTSEPDALRPRRWDDAQA